MPLFPQLYSVQFNSICIVDLCKKKRVGKPLTQLKGKNCKVYFSIEFCHYISLIILRPDVQGASNRKDDALDVAGDTSLIIEIGARGIRHHILVPVYLSRDIDMLDAQ